MAGPITWRTVQGASLADAARPLALASDAITGGFDRLGALVEKQQGVNQGFVDRADEAVTQNFLERLQSAKSPEQIAAMEASGELAAMRASLKPKQLAQVRGAEDARTAGLMTQITQRTKFQNDQLDQEQAPLRDRIMGLIASNKMAEAVQLFQANPQLRNGAAILQAITNGERDFEKFGWLRTDEQRKVAGEKDRVEMAPLQRDAVVASTNASNASAQASQSAVTRSNEEAVVRNLDRINTQFTTTAGKLSDTTKGVVGSPEGTASLVTNLGKVFAKDPDALKDATAFVNQAIASNPEFKNLPTDVVESIVMKRADEFGSWFGTPDYFLVGGMAKDMAAALEDPGVLARMESSAAGRAQLVSLMQEQRSMLDQAQAAAYPGMPRQAAAAPEASSPPVVGTVPEKPQAVAPAKKAISADETAIVRRITELESKLGEDKPTGPNVRAYRQAEEKGSIYDPDYGQSPENKALRAAERKRINEAFDSKINKVMGTDDLSDLYETTFGAYYKSTEARSGKPLTPKEELNKLKKELEQLRKEGR